MKGRHVISITSRKASYRLELERKISILKGNSGTGKSSVVRLISEYLEYGKQSGIKLMVDTSAALKILTNSLNWPDVLSSVHDSILFIDEDVQYLYSINFQRELWQADCYAVIISRSGLFTALPYSVFGIYELITEKKGVQTATTMYRLYEKEGGRNRFDLVLTEDSNSGFEMAQYALGSEQTKVLSAKGNASVLETLTEMNRLHEQVCVNVDGAAFGAFIEPVLKYAELQGNTLVSAPESFEYVLLNIKEVKMYLSTDYGEITRTYDYCESAEYASWEQYYEDLLKRVSSDHLGFTYGKRKLNSWFMNKNCAEQYVSQILRSFVMRREDRDR